jgi:hypothetical protein
MDSITIDNSILSNVDGSIVTTIGRVIANYLLLSSNFGNKIKFINKKK